MPGVAEELNQGSSLATLTPLRIQPSREVTSGQLTAYKAPYDHAIAKNALETAGVFEGAISLFALDASPVVGTDMDNAITGVTGITWKSVEIAMKVFDEVEIVHSPVQDHLNDGTCVKRTMWPGTLTSALDNEDLLKLDRKALHSGHLLVFAWYMSMLRQLDEGPDSEVLRLLQCALTPTVQIRTNLRPAERAKWSIDMSNKISDGQGLADNFLTFAKKCWVVLGLGPHNAKDINQAAKLTALKKERITFGDMVMNKAMVGAMEKVNDPEKVNAKSLDMLRLIEARFGRDVMTSGYVKLKELIDICEREADLNREPVCGNVLWSLEYLYWSLAVGSVQAGTVTQDYLKHGEKGQKNYHGLVMKGLALKQIITNQIPGWVDDMCRKTPSRATMSKNMRPITADFASFMTFLDKFEKELTTGAVAIRGDTHEGSEASAEPHGVEGETEGAKERYVNTLDSELEKNMRRRCTRS